MPKTHVVGADDADDDLTSRSDRRRAERVREDAIERLAADLAALSDNALAKLELPESALEALVVARKIKSHRARARQLRLVRNLLRDNDWASLRVQLDHLLEHGRLPDTAMDEGRGAEQLWLVRLMGEGTVALEDLLTQCPNADRTHLRQLVRTAQNATGDRRKRAEQQLIRALRALL